MESILITGLPAVNMLYHLLIVAVLFLINPVAGSAYQSPQKSAAKDVKPKAEYGKYGFAFTALDGKKVSLSDYAGKVVLVNIWAPWCGPCKKEAPGFLNLYKKYHSKGFEILSIAVQTNETDVRSFLATYPLSWPVGIKDEVAMNYKTYGLPDNYVFKPDGSVAKHFIGFTSEEALRPLLDELINKPK